MQKCAEYIKLGMSATEAANKCGFNDYSNFVRAFSKMFGGSPRKYYKDSITPKDNLFQVEG